MRYFALRAAAAAVLLSGCAAERPDLRMRQSRAATAEVQNACAGLDRVDLAPLSGLSADWTPFDRFHAQARAGVAALPALTSDIILKLAIPGGSLSAPYGTSVFAAQQPDGRWRVSHVRLRQLAPPPQPPGTPQLAAGPERIVTTGYLKPEAVDRIQAAIGSECYRQEPLVSPADLPLRNGQTSQCPPDAGQPNALEIIQNRNARRYLRECGRTWATGVIIITLENPANILPA